MAHVILVHGLGATDNSWFDIPQKLEAAGHTVEKALLPAGRGLDDCVTEILSKKRAGANTVLIGHSMGGVSISQAASTAGADISKLIYVTALVPAAGESAGVLIPNPEASMIAAAAVFGRFGIGPGHPARRMPSFGAEQDPFTPSAGFGAIPKHYVRCSSDTVIPPQDQTTMIAKWPGTTESTVPADHIPQVEAPDDLARELIAAIGGL